MTEQASALLDAGAESFVMSFVPADGDRVADMTAFAREVVPQLG
jgi:hypothetical protein